MGVMADFISKLDLRLRREYEMVSDLNEVKFDGLGEEIKFWLGEDCEMKEGGDWIAGANLYHPLVQFFSKGFEVMGEGFSFWIFPVYRAVYVSGSKEYFLDQVEVLFERAYFWNEVYYRFCRKRCELKEKEWRDIEEQLKEEGKSEEEIEDMRKFWKEHNDWVFDEYRKVEEILRGVDKEKEAVVLDERDNEIFDNNLIRLKSIIMRALLFGE